MSSPVMQIRSRIPRLAEGAFERARLTVVPSNRVRATRMPFIALVSMVLLGGVVGLLLFNTSMQQASFASSALEDQASTLTARQQTLEMELERLRDPQRIAGAAMQLGMVQACSPAFLKLGTGTVTGEPCPGTGATRLRINPLPPGKPAAINPPPHVVFVDPPAANGANGTDEQKADHKSGQKSDDTGSGSAARTGGDGKKNQ